MRPPACLATASALLAALSGCAAMEPYDRRHAWRPTGAAELDIAAMAQSPADLAQGRGLAATDGQAAAAAVARLRLDRLKPLSGGSSAPAVSGAATLAAG